MKGELSYYDGLIYVTCDKVSYTTDEGLDCYGSEVFEILEDCFNEFEICESDIGKVVEFTLCGLIENGDYIEYVRILKIER